MRNLDILIKFSIVARMGGNLKIVKFLHSLIFKITKSVNLRKAYILRFWDIRNLKMTLVWPKNGLELDF